MKNRERFKNELIEACKNKSFHVFFNKYITPMYNCPTYGGINEEERILLTMLWLDEEYQQPYVNWHEISVDTPVLVKNREEDDWNRRYFAKVVGEKVITFVDGQTSWTSDGCLIDWAYAKLP